MSTPEDIRAAIARVTEHVAANPAEAQSADKPAVATLESGLRCRAEGPNGAVLVSDMPKGVGGGGTAPTPGWFMRAALANCDATLIAMRAAQLGVALQRLEVQVDSRSDDRRIFDLQAGVPAGPLSVHVTVRIAADGASAEQLQELVGWAERHSPVSDALRRAVPVTTVIEA